MHRCCGAMQSISGVHPPGKGAASELVPSAVVQLGSTCPAIVPTLAACRSTCLHQSDVADHFHLYLTHQNSSGESSDLHGMVRYSRLQRESLITYMGINDGHGGGVRKGNLVGVIITNAIGVQIPKVGPLRDAARLEVGPDLIVNSLQELIPHGVPHCDALTRPCTGHAHHSTEAIRGRSTCSDPVLHQSLKGQDGK